MSGQNLAERLFSEAESIETIGAWLDSLAASERLAQCRSLNRPQQRRLYELAEKAPALSLADFVPTDVGNLVEVIHEGRNTLPLPQTFKLFQKRFCRPADGSERLFGYNEGATRGLIGPGYFVMIPTKGKPAWEARGSLVVDYFQVPDDLVVSGWPKVVPNHVGLQVLVYHQTRDYMRKVSRNVTIGAAYKGEKCLHQWFILDRQDAGERP
jgi:hypothetical protein